MRASRLGKLLYPAAAKVSLYLSMPIACSHSHTDHSGTSASDSTDTHTSGPEPGSSTVAMGLDQGTTEEEGGARQEGSLLT